MSLFNEKAGVSLERLHRLDAFLKAKCLETGILLNALSAEAHHGVDQGTLAGRAYAVARQFKGMCHPVLPCCRNRERTL